MNAPENQVPWLEDDDAWEGVGAHRDNLRYDPVDEESKEASESEEASDGAD